MKKDIKSGVFRFLRLLPLITVAVLVVIFWDRIMSITPQEIVSHINGNPVSSVLIVMLGYTLECLSIVFPVVVMQISVGLLFPVWAALIVNLMGLLLAANLGYFLGKFTGEDFARRFATKYGKAEALADIDPRRTFHYAFLLRAVSVLPMDAVSMVFGSMNVPYWPYLAGTLAGTIPTMAAVTVAGTSVTEPGSPAFITSVSITVCLSVFSLLLGRRMKKQRAREADKTEASSRQ